jgi:hypothetical protein
MSTHIKTITGIKNSTVTNSDLIETNVSLTRFWSGAEKGSML